MKKNIKNIALKLLCLSAFVLSFISCKEVSEDGNKPALEVEGSKIIVSFAIDEKAKYINVFRREVINLETEEYGDPLNIGQVIPKKDQQTSFTFVDAFICKGANYQYRVRYCMGDYYYLSNWSDVRKNDDAIYAIDSELISDTGSCYLQYNPTTSSLTLKGGSITAKVGVPALVFSYKDKETTVSRVFALPTEEEDPILKKTLKEEDVIDLRSLLTADFFSKDISLDWFIGEEVCKYGSKQEEGDDIEDVYGEKVYWSLPSEIEVKDKDGNILADPIRIDINNADNGHDYSFEGIESSKSVTESVSTITSKTASKEYFFSK